MIVRDHLSNIIADLVQARGALTKIDAIRNSIVETQSINWSGHIYPLVAALREAGYEGTGSAEGGA